MQFLHIALGSAVECAYLAGVAARLEYLVEAEGVTLASRYSELAQGLQAQLDALGRTPDSPAEQAQCRKPKA